MERDVCCKLVRLCYDPLQIFKASRTPAGLYARQKWLDELGKAQWQDDFHKTLHSLMSGQSDDGSWNQSPLETIRRLFGLHLTIRNQTLEIEKALDWLMRHTLPHSTSNLAGPIAPSSPDAFAGLPFTPGHTHVSVVFMTLFLVTVFQKGEKPDVLAHYDLLSLWVAQNASFMDTASDKSNALRALVVHKEFAEDRATAALVNDFEKIQAPSGYWSGSVPFFQTVNALKNKGCL